jgi:hypothetical protein
VPPDQWPRLRQAIFDRVKEPQWTTLLEECGLNLPPREPPPRPSLKDRFVNQCIPPAAIALKQRLGRILPPLVASTKQA